MNVSAPRVCVGCLLALVLVACGNRVTRENFERIESGMHRDEVVALLGEPDDMSSMAVGTASGAIARWEGGDYVISVVFAGNEVAFKSFGRR